MGRQLVGHRQIMGRVVDHCEEPHLAVLGAHPKVFELTIEDRVPVRPLGVSIVDNQRKNYLSCVVPDLLLELMGYSLTNTPLLQAAVPLHPFLQG